MLVKLIKYDLRYMIKNMTPFYIIAIVFSIFSRILNTYNNSTFLFVLSQICVGCMFAMVASTLVNTVMRSWVRFSNTLYKDESYLYHTLPVSRTTLFEAKFLKTIIFALINFLFVVVSLLITYGSKENFNLLKNYFETISNATSLNVGLILVLFVIILFLEMFNIVQSGFLGIIISNNKKGNKTLISFIYGLIIYILSQGTVVLLILLLGLFNSNIMAIFKDMIVLSNRDFIILFVSLVIDYTFICILMNLISVKLFNKKINIE